MTRILEAINPTPVPIEKLLKFPLSNIPLCPIEKSIIPRHPKITSSLVLYVF